MRLGIFSFGTSPAKQTESATPKRSASATLRRDQRDSSGVPVRTSRTRGNRCRRCGSAAMSTSNSLLMPCFDTPRTRRTPDRPSGVVEKWAPRPRARRRPWPPDRASGSRRPDAWPASAPGLARRRSEACSSAQRACSSTWARSGSWLRTCQYAPVNGSALPASSTVGHGERKTNAPNDSSTSAPQRLAMRGRTRCSQTRRPTNPRVWARSACAIQFDGSAGSAAIKSGWAISKPCRRARWPPVQVPGRERARAPPMRAAGA